MSDGMTDKRSQPDEGGGIGGGRPIWDDERGKAFDKADPLGVEERDISAPPHRKALLSTTEKLENDFAAMQGALGELVANHQTIVDNINAVVASTQQQAGQISQLEGMMQQVYATLHQFDARLNALAQQTARLPRYAVLEIASKCRQPGEAPSSVIKLAQSMLEFVQPDIDAARGVPQRNEAQNAPAPSPAPDEPEGGGSVH